MSSRMQGFSLLPNELIIQVMSALDLKSLLRCRQVCKLFDCMVQEAAALQYTIELSIAGMEDGPPSSLGTSDRLAKLRMHQHAWRNLQFGAPRTVQMLRGGTWELYGGVLAQSHGPRGLSFKQLPSDIRGIEDKEWEIKNVGFTIRDFAMDPAQNLLVVVETPRGPGDEYHIHLRALDTGMPHPATLSPSTLGHSPDGDNYSYAIQVSAEYLGVLFVSGDEMKSELVIWNWKTSARVLWLCGADLGYFAFLDDVHIIMLGAIIPPDEEPIHPLGPQLIIIDFVKAPNGMVELDDAEFVCTFHYPTLNPLATPLSMSVRSDPAPSWSPSSDLKVPFYTTRHERLLVITLWVADSITVLSLLLFVPSSVLLSHVKSLKPGETKRRFLWEAWGPEGTRMMFAPQGHSAVWVCYVWGQKFICPKRFGRRKAIQIHDFNQLPCRRLAANADRALDPDEFVRERSVISAGRIFERDVTTSLPYRLWTLLPPADESGGNFDAVMVSEDTLITVASQPRNRKYRILTL